MTYEEFKQNFLGEFLKLQSFASKKNYADQYLQRIGSGTGRIVYDIDGQKILKLAKNTKGIAQNEVEAGAGYYRDTHNIVTIVFDSADDNNWLISEKAKKVNEKRIKELTGVPSLNDLYYYVRNFVSTNNGRGNIFNQKPEMVELLDNNEWVQELTEFIMNYSQQPGDYGRPSTYGEVLRDGQPTIVLTDYGLNDEVYDTYYAPKKPQPYRMYELYNFADGNDDILSDIGNVGADQRHGMWGLMPYGVEDGGGVVNEDFISFVLNRDKYPTRPLPSMPYVVDQFHECVNNLKENLNHVDDKKQFYNKLLELQNYLISQNFYDREPLTTEEYIINEVEVIPNVKADTLSDKTYGIQLANEISSKLNLGQPKFLGGGANGFAFELNNNTILKITADVSEADAAAKLLRAKPKYLAKIFNLYKLVDTEKNLSFFAIVEENIIDKPIEKFRRYDVILDTIKPNGMGLEDFFSKMRKANKFNYDEMVEDAKHILTDYPEANIAQTERQETYEYVIGLLNIRNELIELGITKSTDYTTIANLGYKDGVLKYFDVGGYHGVLEPNVGDNIITLPENINEEILSEDYNRETADTIAKKIVEMRELTQLTFIGNGLFGVAYDIGNDRVLKITSDKSEAAENLRLRGRELKHIAEPYEIYSIKAKTSIPETYAIILEKLKTDPAKFKRIKERIDFAFDKILDLKYADVIDYYVNGGLYDGEIDERQVDKYMSRNSEDAEFFYGILEIARECKKYGVESMDYLNYTNLGYKPDGSLGFFDVGFGNWFMKSDPVPLEIELGEDGTSKFSTINSIGQDDFPPYVQNDTSPLADNNVPTDDEIHEDLEYSHVSDATQDKYELDERITSSMAGSSTVDVKKKCRLGGLGNTSAACNQGDINNLKIKPLKESFVSNNTFWAWVSPDDQFIQVPKLNHKGYIMTKYKDREFGWDYDRVFDTAIKDGWVRVIYEKFPNDFRAELSLNGYDESRIKQIFKKMFYDLVKYGNNAIYLEWENPKGHLRFSTRNSEGKAALVNYVSEGVGDTYAEKEFNMPHPNTDFETRYNKEKNRENQEEKLGDGDMISLIKNPKSLKNIGYGVRGVIDNKGNLYLEETSKVIHQEILDFLEEKGLISGAMKAWDEELPKFFITVQRYEKNNIIGLGESNSQMYPNEERTNVEFWDRIPSLEESTPVYQEFFDRARPKNPSITFINKVLRYYYNKINEDVEETSSCIQIKTIPEIEEYVKKFDSDESLLRSGGLPTDLLDKAAFGFDDTLNMIAPKHLTVKWKDDMENVIHEIQRTGLSDYAWAKKINLTEPIDVSFDGKKFYIEDGHHRYYAAKILQKPLNMNLEIKANPISKLGGNLDYDDFHRCIWKQVHNQTNIMNEEHSEAYDKEFPIIVGDKIDELHIRNNVPNMSSIEASLTDYKILNGIREVSFSKSFPEYPHEPKSYNQEENERTKNLAQEISNNKEISPLIVVVDNEGAYVLEGGHRFDALRILGIDRFPAKIVLDLESLNDTEIMNETQIMSLQDLPFKQEVEQLGGKIHSVGGAVRDEFLGKESKDLDILITGIPMDKLEQILSKYGRVDAVGKSFGVLKFKPRGATEDIDIAIPRTEKPTGAGGHQGFDVTSDHALPIEKDLERRDFTINAIAKDINGNIIDPYGGQEDLKNKIIRVVNPEAFADDPLRMLRAVQFASRFGFKIEPKTMLLIQNNAQRIKEIPPERILTEFDKIIKKGNKLTGALLLKSTGLLRNIFGADAGLLIGNNVWENIQTIGEFIWMLSHNLVQNPAEFYRNNLKGDIDTYKEIKALQMAFESSEATNLIEARSVVHNMYLSSPQSIQSKILPNVIKTAAQELLQGKYPKTVGELAINGNDLMSLGLKGKAIGDTLKSLLLKIYSNKIRNNREELLSLSGQGDQMLNEEKKKTVEKIEYGALMLFLDIPVWKKITSIIKKEDLFDKPGFGIEKEPHLTILYGFHKEVTPEDVFELYKKTTELKPIEVKIKGISIFENPNFDVVKFDVNSKILNELNDTMRQLPNTTNFPEYHAHITLAYVNKGEGKKYVKLFEKERVIVGNKLVFSTKEGEKKTLMLKEKGILNEEYNEVENGKYQVNDEIVDIDFFIKKYDEWNNQGGYPGNSDPSEASVLEFFQNNYEDYSHNEKLKKQLLWALTDREVLNENKSKSDYTQTKESIMKSKTISKEMKEEILKYLAGGSTYHEGQIRGLRIPDIEGKSFNGVSMGADKNGFFVYTHRARSKSHASPNKISDKEIKFIESTG